MGGGAEMDLRTPAGRGRFLCRESSTSHPPQPHFSPPATRGRHPFLEAILPSQLGPSAFWAFVFHSHHQNAILLKILKVYKFAEERKTILFAS